MKKLSAIFLILCLVLTCFAACGGTGDNDPSTSLKAPEESLDNVKVGSFEEFTAIDLSGKKISSDIFKGKKLTMVNIWATFCGPCINEMPDIEKLSQEYANEGLQVIGIVSDISNDSEGIYDEMLLNNALDIIKSTGVTYTNLLPSESLNTIKLSEVYSVPETFFVDENGNVIGESYIGSRSFETWEEIVKGMLENM